MRHLSLLAAMLLPCIAPGAGAQLTDQTPVAPTRFVVTATPGNFTWTASKLVWGNAPSRIVEPKMADRAEASLQPRLGSKPASNTVELISPTQSSDNSWVLWLNAGHTPAPKDVTITAMGPAGTPVARWVLRGAVPTKVQINQMDAGASQVALTRITLTAQSVSVVAP